MRLFNTKQIGRILIAVGIFALPAYYAIREFSDFFVINRIANALEHCGDTECVAHRLHSLYYKHAIVSCSFYDVKGVQFLEIMDVEQNPDAVQKIIFTLRGGRKLSVHVVDRKVVLIALRSK
jgi:hypothetical protein